MKKEMKMHGNNGQSVRAVFWDIDGTLIDSEELHYQVIVDWCQARGYVLKKEDNDALLGKSNAEKWQILSGRHPFEATLDSFKKDIAKRYCEAVSKDLQRDEAVAIFREIGAAGVTLACVSNGDMVVVEANLKAMGLFELAAFCISGDDVKNGKPDPEPYLLAAKKLGLAPEECLVVEDSLVGVAAGVAAGMTVVAWPEEGASQAKYQNADYFVTCKEEFPLTLLPLE